MYTHTYVYIIFGGSQKRTLAISSNKKMNEASAQKCLTAIVGKAFPEEYTIQTHICAYVFIWAAAVQCVCVCGSHLPKVLMYFFGVVGNLRQIMYLCQENPQILGILQRLIAIREQIIIIIFISKRAFVRARKYLGQGDNCLHLTDLRSNLRYSAVACDQTEVLKWISESVHLPPAPFHPPRR